MDSEYESFLEPATVKMSFKKKKIANDQAEMDYNPDNTTSESEEEEEAERPRKKRKPRKTKAQGEKKKGGGGQRNNKEGKDGWDENETTQLKNMYLRYKGFNGGLEGNWKSLPNCFSAGQIQKILELEDAKTTYPSIFYRRKKPDLEKMAKTLASKWRNKKTGRHIFLGLNVGAVPGADYTKSNAVGYL